MVQVNWEAIISEDGALKSDQTVDRTVLYTGRNGKSVERFRLSAAPERGTFIFKPLTNPETVGCEEWLYEHLIPMLPVRVPGLLAAASHRDPDRYWAVFEDLGTLTHGEDECAVTEAAQAIATWHELPIDLLPGHFHGDKPPVREAQSFVWEQRGLIEQLWKEWGNPQFPFVQWLEVLENADRLKSTEKVVCHGDFHYGNLACVDGDLVILDWEHAHVNDVYWDLYHLLDMTHPQYRRLGGSALRIKALDRYGSARSVRGWTGYSERFIDEYHLFASIYSAWMIVLIDRDLRQGSWNQEGLTRQMEETCRILEECGKRALASR